MRVVVTTTHDRPLCLSILERWVAAQTVQPDRWLVVNDSERPEEYAYKMGQEVIVRTDDGLDEATCFLPSICKNWLAACDLLGPEDRVFVFEDDDFYHPEFLATLDKLLDKADLVGVNRDVYYKLPSRKYIRMGNEHHASLAATAFRGSILEPFRRACRVFKSPYIDMFLWVEAGTVFPCEKKLITQPLDDGRMLHVGLKNMPGARGYGLGHGSAHGWSEDPTFQILESWVGRKAAEVYRHITL